MIRHLKSILFWSLFLCLAPAVVLAQGAACPGPTPQPISKYATWRSPRFGVRLQYPTRWFTLTDALELTRGGPS